MHWSLRVLIAVMGGFVGGVVGLVVGGFGGYALAGLIGSTSLEGSLILVQAPLAVVAVSLVSIWIYTHLPSARVEDHETRCRKCGYILRGITEPRCSECGERI